ncbi:MAG: hypothetical protein L0271_25410 [Gemmatimonadetes bacterium]|nr:hypothetical protein [Gemmatimonadota bacterium]
MRAILAFVALALFIACGDNIGPEGPTDLREAFSHGTCRGRGVVRYAAAPLNISDVGSFVPLGTVTGNHVTPIDHQYLYPVNLNTSRTHYDVFAPFSGNIVLIQPRVKRAGDPGPAPVGSVDYRVVFEGSCTYWVYYDLLTELEPGIRAGGGSDLAANRSAYVRIPIQAGQRVGKLGQQGLDLGTVNAEVTLPGLLVPEHYAAEPWKIHSVDGLDYFDEPLRSQLNALNLRKALPRGGKIDYDIDGKAVGNWFLVGTNGYAGARGTTAGNAYWVGHLSLIYGHIDPSLILISMGMPDGSSRQWPVRGNAPDPATIEESSGLVKYEVLQLRGDSVRRNLNSPLEGVLLVQALPARQLRVEYFHGLDASRVTAFTAAAKLYER